MVGQAVPGERSFKTAWFSKAAKKAHISDDELCDAIQQVMLGQADDLGGGVFKNYWVYTYLFAKNDRANIGDDELTNFRAVAGLYARKTDADIAKELLLYELKEICHD